MAMHCLSFLSPTLVSENTTVRRLPTHICLGNYCLLKQGFVFRKRNIRGILLQAVLAPLSSTAVVQLIPSWCTWNQYKYFCFDPRALLDRSAIASYGLFCVYLLGDVLGRSLSLGVSLVFLLWPFVAPAFQACLRNLQLRKFPHVALFSGRITDMYLVHGNGSKLGYPTSKKAAELLYLTVEDFEGRRVQARAWHRRQYA
eukprot:jgi/Galph1/3053/GphlegSOOS_G1726.1